MTDGLAPQRLDRAELISLLEALGSENDEEVLAAARVLDTKVSAAGTSWSVLLSPSVGVPQAATADPGEAGDEEAPAAEPLPGDPAAGNAQALALIEKLLARGGHSDELRQELEGYKADIAEGEFTDSDHTYLRALYKRLTG